jgi:hypothetical protein
MSFLAASSNTELTNYLPAVKAYREKYGIWSKAPLRLLSRPQTR